MKTLFCLLFGITFFLTISGRSQSSFVGSWLHQTTTQEGKPYVTKVTTDIDGSFTVDLRNDNIIDLEGYYELKDDILSIWDKEGISGCDAQFIGKYTFSIYKDTLIINETDKLCEGCSSKLVLVLKRI